MSPAITKTPLSRRRDKGVFVIAGLIDDPWVLSQNLSWGYRGLMTGVAERNRMSERSDVGALVGIERPNYALGIRLTTGAPVVKRIPKA